ncbi:MAG: hypothetical protein U0Q18_14780 [Bryobacteraceae bacterium]
MRQFSNEVFGLAKNAFELSVSEICEQQANKERIALAEASKTGNTATYPYVLVQLARERVEATFLAGVDAYLDVYTNLSSPADDRTEEYFEKWAIQIAGGVTSWVEGQVGLYRGRTRREVSDPSGDLNRTVRRSLSLLKKKAKLQLAEQRVKLRPAKDEAALETPKEAESYPGLNFWGRMASQFRVLQRDDGPFVQWTAKPYNADGSHWYVGGADHKTREKFRWAAERAAIQLGHNVGNMAVFGWLDLLKRDSPDYKSYIVRDGSEAGKIKQVSNASADYCLRLESKQVAAELKSIPTDLESRRTLEEEGYTLIRRSDWREDAARARKPSPLLRPVKNARLAAIATLNKETAAAVQSTLPPTKQQLEICLWPALSKYAQKVFDKLAEARLNSKAPQRRPEIYGSWLRSKGLEAVVEDICRPIFGQFPITVRFVIESIGQPQSRESEVTLRRLWGMLTEMFGDRIFTNNLTQRLTAQLEARSIRWEARATQPRPAAHRIKGKPSSDDRPTDKRDLSLLRGPDGKLKRVVTVTEACRYGGVGQRAIQKACQKGSLRSESEGPNRRIVVQSILEYFPPEK